jgi:hypothetical protein
MNGVPLNSAATAAAVKSGFLSLRGFELCAVLPEPGCEGPEFGVEFTDLGDVAVAGEALVVFGVELDRVR